MNDDMDSGCNRPTPTLFDEENKLHLQLACTYAELMKDVAPNMKRLKPTTFDKENDLHLRMVSLLAEVKCDCFRITNRNFEKWRVQRIGGHSIPSIISSTAVAAGLNCLNLYAIAARKCGANASNPMKCLGSLFNYALQMDFGLAPSEGEIAHVVIPSGKLSVGDIKARVVTHFKGSFQPDDEEMDCHYLEVVARESMRTTKLFSQTAIDNHIFHKPPVFARWWSELELEESKLFLFQVDPSSPLPSLAHK